MIYPKKASSSQAKKRQISKQQRDELKKLVGENMLNKYPNMNAEQLQDQVDTFFDKAESINSVKLRELDQNLAQKDKQEANNIRDDISVRSDVSKMSGATDYLSQAPADNASNTKRETITINFLPKSKVVNQHQSKVEEELEWAGIYQKNNAVYKEMDNLHKIKIIEEKKRFMKELDKQVAEKDYKKVLLNEEKKVDLAQTLLKVQREEEKERLKAEEKFRKVKAEKQMRDKQLREIMQQRKQEKKDQRQIDKFIISKIKQEQQQDIVRREHEKANQIKFWKKTLEENEEKQQRMRVEEEREKQETIQLMEDYARMIDKREKERELEFKAKEERVQKIFESGKHILGKPKDNREKRQDEKLKVYNERIERVQQLEAEKEKEIMESKKIAQKLSLEQQMQEKKERQEQERIVNEQQAKIWVEDAQRFRDFEKEKVDHRKNQLAIYGVELRQQMKEKMEEKMANSRLLQLREAQWRKRPYA